MRTYRILTVDPIARRGLNGFPSDRYTVGSDLADPDAVLVRSRNLHAMSLAPSVEAVGRAGAGTNNIPVAALSQRGIPVFNAPGANANAVNELVLAGLLLAARHIVPALRFVDAIPDDVADLGRHVEDAKHRFSGVELAGRSLGVIGLGAVGSAVAATALKLGMHVHGFDPALGPRGTERVPSEVRRADDLARLLKDAEFVSLHVPLVPATTRLIDDARLASMKRGSVLLNFARPEVVDPQAVAAALHRGQLRCYVSDFPETTLRAEANAILLPHLGASTIEAEEHCAAMVVDEVRAFLEHGTIRNAVNFPDVDMARGSPHRIGIAHANVPNMLGQISSTFARSGLNIHSMRNESREDMAYTLVDVDSAFDASTLAALEAIAGVLAVRPRC